MTDHCDCKPDQGCYYCCDSCNYDRHICHFCGQTLSHENRNGCCMAYCKEHGDIFHECPTGSHRGES